MKLMLAALGGLGMTATAALAGVSAPPPSVSDGSDGVVALVLILGALVIAGGLVKPMDPPDGE